jgi:hypothetical protein
MTKITPEIIRELLDYDPETGELYWRERNKKWFENARIWKSWNGRYAGKPAFTTVKDGRYRHGSILGKSLRGHRVAWAHHHGEWPKFQLDHIEHARGRAIDNRIANLRDVSALVNMKNQRKSSRNSSGVTGVQWFPRTKKWMVSIFANGKRIHLGYFHSKEDAIAARRDAEKKFGFSELHGRQ